MSLFEELKRRNVIRVAIAYVLLGWAVLQGADFMLDLVGAPEWVIRVFAIAGLVGFPFAIFFAWAFEMTPEGVKREEDVDRTQSITPRTGRRLDRLIILCLGIAVAFLLIDRFIDRDPVPAESVAHQGVEEPKPNTTEEPVPGRRSVAVLPFVAMTRGADDEYFADGLTEEILNSLAQLPELLVTARTSAFKFKGLDQSVQEIAAQLGVGHVVEGSIRRSGDRLRVTAQLIRASDAFHVWSENYDSTSQDTIAVQEDIAEKIASALDEVLDDPRREAMRRAGLRDVEAFIALQKGFERFDEAHAERNQVESLLNANQYFEQVLERVPGYPPALIDHADAYTHMLDLAAWADPEEFESPYNLDEALVQAVSDYSLAAENARNFDERAAIEFDLAMLNGDLRGVKRRLENYLQLDGCEHPSWIDPLASVFGYADQLTDRLDVILRCDPMAPVMAFSHSRAAQWAGDPERALEIAMKARETLSHPWLDVAVINAHLAMGRYETAASELSLWRGVDLQGQFLEIVLAAVQGERDRAEKLYQDFRDAPGTVDFDRLQIQAMLGDRDTANEIAARVDQRAKLPMSLMLATLWCQCGAPFDLEATPNFAAKLQEGDLPWPPPTPIQFPLKDW